MLLSPQVLAKNANAVLGLLASIPALYSAEVRTLIRRCLTADPEHRPTAKELFRSRALRRAERSSGAGSVAGAPSYADAHERGGERSSGSSEEEIGAASAGRAIVEVPQGEPAAAALPIHALLQSVSPLRSAQGGASPRAFGMADKATARSRLRTGSSIRAGSLDASFAAAAAAAATAQSATDDNGETTGAEAAVAWRRQLGPQAPVAGTASVSSARFGVPTPAEAEGEAGAGADWDLQAGARRRHRRKQLQQRRAAPPPAPGGTTAGSDGNGRASP